MSHDARFSLGYADAVKARRVAAAIQPEVDDIDGERTSATIERADDVLQVRVTADDLVALRAGLNTWLSLVSVAERTGGVGAQDSGPSK